MPAGPASLIARLEDRAALDAWRGTAGGVSVGLVPTMGGLHEGHLSLVDAAHEHARRVVASIFVNPTQFAPNEDFASYPRNEAGDLAMLAARGVDLVFTPDAEEMFADGFATTVTVVAESLANISAPSGMNTTSTPRAASMAKSATSSRG